jgi:conjugal transfer ATP-binding protein TraC
LIVNRIGDLLRPLAFDDERLLFALDDDTIGFGFWGAPLSGADAGAMDRVNTLLNDDWPPGTLLQFSLWAGPDVLGYTDAFQGRRHTDEKDENLSASRRLLRAYVGSVVEFQKRGAESRPEPADASGGVRNQVLIITAKLPTGGGPPSEAQLRQAVSLRGTFERALRAAGLGLTPLRDDAYLRIAETLVNWGRMPAWKSGKTTVDGGMELNRQVADYDVDLRVEANGVWLRDVVVKTLSVKRMPTATAFGAALSYLGDQRSGSRGIRENALITATLYFPDIQTTRSGLERKRTWTVNQAHGPLTKFIPELAERKVAFDEMHEAMQKGDRPVKLYLGMALFAAGLEAAERAASNARTYWSEMGLQIMEDRHMHLPCLLNCLPFGADAQAIPALFRYRTLATRHAVPLLPLFGDWQGTGTPDFLLTSRNGQPMAMSLYDSDASFNAVIAAQSGSGKSFLTNEIISAYLSLGAQIWCIDVGGSYAKQVEMYQGDLLDFDGGRQACINPFPLVADYSDEEDILAGLVVAMAAPTQPLSDLQTAELKRAMKAIWDVKGQRMTVDDLAEQLAGHEDQRIRDVGSQLYPFTSRGEYGRYLVGANTVSFRKDFTVLELEALKGRRHLQQVVLLELVYQIQQTVYRGDRSRPKLVIIDEAWDLLSSSSVGAFMNDAYRRFRKYGASAIVIMQSVSDLYENPVGRAIAENSPNMYLLGQKAEAIDTLKNHSRLSLSAGGYELLKSVHTIAGAYSEIFCITQRGVGVGRLIVDPFRMLMYSTQHKDVADIKRYQDRGLDVVSAIREVLRERRSA